MPLESVGRERLVAAVVTVVVALLLLVTLLLLKLRYSPADSRVWERDDAAELLFEDEWVARGDVAEPDRSDRPSAPSSPAPAAGGADVTDEGSVAPKPARTVATEREQEVKVVKQEDSEKKGPTKEELAERERERVRQETARRIASTVKFGSGDAGDKDKAAGAGGNGAGTGKTGLANGVGGHSLKGRTASLAKPRAKAAGSIRIAVKVDRQGNVKSARYHDGSGAVATNHEARQSCVEAAYNSRFSADENADALVDGFITFNFR